MDLELRFDGLDADVLDAVVDVRVADLRIADAPAGGPAATSSGLSVTADHPTARVTLDLPVDGGMYEPGLLVRVRGRTPDGARVEFFTTSATPATAADGPVPVLLSRIA